MSHLSEFRAQTAMTPGPRKEGINTAWDCYTTASKTARAYRFYLFPNLIVKSFFTYIDIEGCF